MSSKIIKVLILAYDFPPFVSVGGLRPYSWYKYLSEYGVYPIIITRQFKIEFNNSIDYVNEGTSDENEIEESEKGIVIRTPYKPNLSNKLLLKYGAKRFIIIRKVVTVWFEFFQWFFITGPKKGLYIAADKYLKNNKVDVIIATGDPFVLFRYASNLGEKYCIPWIADYRDPWLQDKSRKRNFVLRFFESNIERKLLKTASKVVTVSDFLRTLINKNNKDVSFNIIPNGFDDDAIYLAQRENLKKEELVIAFSGSIYNWHPWVLFFNVMVSFLESNPDKKITMMFYGINEEEKLREYINENCISLKGKVSFFDRLPNEKLHQELMQAHVFLLFNDYSILGTKIFDYLALKRKILFCFSESNEAILLKEKFFHLSSFNPENERLQEELIKKTNSGIIVKDANHLEEVLLDLYSGFKTNGLVPCESVGVENYARSKQVELYAGLIKDVIVESVLHK